MELEKRVDRPSESRKHAPRQLRFVREELARAGAADVGKCRLDCLPAVRPAHSLEDRGDIDVRHQPEDDLFTSRQ